jgi:hypothetical protein
MSGTEVKNSPFADAPCQFASEPMSRAESRDEHDGFRFSDLEWLGVILFVRQGEVGDAFCNWMVRSDDPNVLLATVPNATEMTGRIDESLEGFSVVR